MKITKMCMWGAFSMLFLSLIILGVEEIWELNEIYFKIGLTGSLISLTLLVFLAIIYMSINEEFK